MNIELVQGAIEQYDCKKCVFYTECKVDSPEGKRIALQVLKKIGYNCENAQNGYYKYKEHWTLCTTENTHIGNIVRNLPTGELYKIHYIINSSTIIIGKHIDRVENIIAPINSFEIDINNPKGELNNEDS